SRSSRASANSPSTSRRRSRAMGKYWLFGGVALSAVIHLAAFAATARIPKDGGHKPTAIMVAAPKKAKKDEKKDDKPPPPPEPPKPIKAPPRMLRPAAAEPPPAQNTPPPAPVANSPAAAAALAAMPDFGISMAGGPGGIAVPMGGGPAP